MRGFCKSRGWDWTRRTHPVYVLRQKRFPLDATLSTQAYRRTVELRGGGGGWDGKTGDGEAWFQRGQRYGFFKRAIRRGRWAGPWRPEQEERKDG